MAYQVLSKTALVVITVFFILLKLSCTEKPTGLVIEGAVEGISDGTVFYLKNWKNNTFIDSANIINGHFVLKGNLSEPEHLFLFATDSLTNEFIYTNLILDNEHVKINTSKNDLPWNVDVRGSKHQDIAEKLNQVEFQRQGLRKSLEENFEGLPETEKDQYDLAQQIKALTDSMNKVKLEVLNENFNSYASLINFKYYKNQIPHEALERLYVKLSPELKESIYGKAVKLQLDYPPVKIGDRYYDYTAVNQYGDTVSISGFENYILLHFSHAACVYSQRSIPELKRIYNQYQEQLEIVKISQDLEMQIWKESILRDSIPWVNLWDGKGEYGNAVVKYGIIGAPNYILVSPDKTIVEKWFGYEDGIIMDKLKKHLDTNEPPR